MAISKVIFKSSADAIPEAWMDVTDTTASQSDVASTKYYYGADGVKKQGSYVAPSAVTQATPTISVNSSTGLITASSTQSAGVVSAGTKSATEQLSTQAAQTLYPSTTDQTISSGKYLTGTQTFKGVLLTNLSAGNIKKDVVVKVGDSADDDRITSVTGTYEGSGGGGVAEEKDVNFIDYDGTIVYSYTKAEFANLSALPANPSHTGLTAQGWNWSLSDAKTYVATYGKLWVGQMYVTSSGDTEIDCDFDNPDLLSPCLKFAVNGTAQINWGDGSATDTVTGTSLSTAKYTQHTYSTTDNYTISIKVTSGEFTFVSVSVLTFANNATSNKDQRYRSSVKAIRIGSGITTLGQAVLQNLREMQYITIPSTITSFGGSVFSYCYSLRAITIPSDVTSIGNSIFVYAYSLRYISLPKALSSIDTTAFQHCCSLQSVTVPSSILGNSSFQYCYGLKTVVIPSNVTSIGSSTLYYCYSLQEITIPSGVTSIGGSAFYYCDTLKTVVIPSNVTSIGSSAFYNCTSLQEVTISSGVTSIAASAFRYCYALEKVHFKATVPPTVANSNAFGNLPDDCIIYVPYSADHSVLAAYQSANNYPSSSTYTYLEET